MFWCPLVLSTHLLFFQHIMNDVFCEYLDDFVVCYINDIFIFSKNKTNHKHHVYFMLEKLWEVRIYVKLEKCEFINLKWDFWATSFLEMAFAWTFIKSKPLLVGLPNFYLKCSMFSWIYPLLSMLHCSLFYNSGSFYSFDSKGSTFFMGSWSKKCLPIFEGFFHNCPTLDTCRSYKTFCFGNEHFWFCIEHYTPTTQRKQIFSSHQLPFFKVFLCQY